MGPRPAPSFRSPGTRRPNPAGGPRSRWFRRRLGGRRLPFAVFCFGVMLAALDTVLVLNISVSGGQYEVVELRNQEQTLTQENEALTQQAQKLEAPQSVAAKAAELGMVVPGSVASIDLKTLKVAGTSSAAKAEEGPTSLVADRETAAGSGSTAAGQATDPVAEAESTQDGATAGEEPANEVPGEDAPAADAPARTVDTEFTEQELNGGTIPAPAQQQPQN